MCIILIEIYALFRMAALIYIIEILNCISLFELHVLTCLEG
jgi:hypothetical protein